jgi:hypothetical protein
MPLVAVVRKCVHDDGGKDIRRSNQALRSRDIESHTFVQNDGKEVRNGVGAGRGQSEQTGETPDLQIRGVGQVLLDIEPGFISLRFGGSDGHCLPLRDDIVAVLFNPCHDKSHFLIIEELEAPCLGRQFGEIDDEGERDDCNDACQDTLLMSVSSEHQWL